MLRPFVQYYGGKWRLAEQFGPPQRDHVVEPCGGVAGYSCFWEPPKVTLIDADPVVCGVWKYLKRVTSRELMRLPSDISHIDELPSRVCQEAKWLIGFWFDSNCATPRRCRSNWALIPKRRRFYWSETIKMRLASQVDHIRHWNIIEGTYEQAPNIDAHWHIDPPYMKAGQHYSCHNVNYRALGRWCKTRSGFIQVCEADGVKWLPFKPFSVLTTHRPTGFSAEALYELEN
jgi:hypothetical protein